MDKINFPHFHQKGQGQVQPVNPGMVAQLNIDLTNISEDSPRAGILLELAQQQVNNKDPDARMTIISGSNAAMQEGNYQIAQEFIKLFKYL